MLLAFGNQTQVISNMKIDENLQGVCAEGGVCVYCRVGAPGDVCACGGVCTVACVYVGVCVDDSTAGKGGRKRDKDPSPSVPYAQAPGLMHRHGQPHTQRRSCSGCCMGPLRPQDPW